MRATIQIRESASEVLGFRVWVVWVLGVRDFRACGVLGLAILGKSCVASSIHLSGSSMF